MFREGKADDKPTKSAPAESVAKKQSELLQSVTKQKKEEAPIPKEAPPEFEFIADPPSISAFDLGNSNLHFYAMPLYWMNVKKY